MKPRVEKSKVYVLRYCPAILIVFCKALLADRIGTAFVFCKSLLADRIGTATSWMRFECKNIVFFRVNGGSIAEKSWLMCVTVAGGRFSVESVPTCARNVTEGSR